MFRMLYDFCQRQGADKVWATYLVVGRSINKGRNGEAGLASVEVRVVGRVV